MVQTRQKSDWLSVSVMSDFESSYYSSLCMVAFVVGLTFLKICFPCFSLNGFILLDYILENSLENEELNFRFRIGVLTQLLKAREDCSYSFYSSNLCLILVLAIFTSH